VKQAFYSATPTDCHLQTIFYFEALSISSAILWASGLIPLVRHLLIFTDSLNCMEMFNTLHALEGYNDILLFVMCILITTGISLRVFHVPGTDNIIADTLSRNLPLAAAASLPRLEIHLFEPPRKVLGQSE